MDERTGYVCLEGPDQLHRFQLACAQAKRYATRHFERELNKLVQHEVKASQRWWRRSLTHEQARARLRQSTDFHDMWAYSTCTHPVESVADQWEEALSYLEALTLRVPVEEYSLIMRCACAQKGTLA